MIFEGLRNAERLACSGSVTAPRLYPFAWRKMVDPLLGWLAGAGLIGLLGYYLLLAGTGR